MKDSKTKHTLHPRNKHHGRYDFESLIKHEPQLETFVYEDDYENITIDFGDALAIKFLNKALLKKYYNIHHWDLPKGYLCPPIPGRADMLHYIADLIGYSKEKKSHILDVGTGANCIYPLLGRKIYGWTFTATEVDRKAIKAVKQIIGANKLTKFIDLRAQYETDRIFRGVVKATERFDACICNPPFHQNLESAAKGTSRKWKNLNEDKTGKDLNFGGQEAELCYPGGELAFIKQMIKESANRPEMCRWYTSLVSKNANLPILTKYVKSQKITDHKVIEMGQGNKVSRILAWTYAKEEA